MNQRYQNTATGGTKSPILSGRKYALFNLFLILREEGKIEEGKKLLHRAVDEEIDLEKSPCALAEYYDHKDIMAFRLYRISAENGYARAQFAVSVSAMLVDTRQKKYRSSFYS